MKFVIIFTALVASVVAQEPKPGSLADGPIGFKRGVGPMVKDIGKEVAKELVADLVEQGIAYIKKELQDSKREISIGNELDSPVWVRCRDKNINIGDREVATTEAYHFFFDRSFWGVTHFWCNVWYNGAFRKPTHFPAYNEGAPADHNIFAIRKDGIYIKGENGFSKLRDRNNE